MQSEESEICYWDPFLLPGVSLRGKKGVGKGTEET